MPKKTCSKCQEDLSLRHFNLDKRSKSGLTSQCKTCINARSAATKTCDGCNKTFRKDWINRHNCKGVQPWQKFKSHGSKIVECPCSWCKGAETSESNAYRHLKYNVGAQSAASAAPHKRQPISDDSD